MSNPGEGGTLPGRLAYVDWLRATSLIIVVIWHWAFTLLVWLPDGPRATSPLKFFDGLWLLTWLFQVMPLFFYIGGFVHLVSWQRAQAKGTGLGPFIWRRIKQLLVPALALLLGWVVLGLLVTWYFDWGGMYRVVRLVVSPLWFLGVYLMLVALLPISLWLHRRFGSLMLVWLAGAAMAVDVLRFRYDQASVAWLNMVLVWALAHQVGFFYQHVADAPRRIDWTLLWGGLFGLGGLVASGLYPGSMVGVPGDRFSNVAPPTFAIVALLVFQIGVVELLRPTMERLLPRPRWRTVNETINRFALPLFLFHTTGMAIALLLLRLAGLYKLERIANPNLAWWLTRPLAILGPLLCTLPVIWLFARKWVRPPAAPALELVETPAPAVPVAAPAPALESAIPAQIAPATALDNAPERAGRLT